MAKHFLLVLLVMIGAARADAVAMRLGLSPHTPTARKLLLARVHEPGEGHPVGHGARGC
jgi:hypothetical protein